MLDEDGLLNVLYGSLVDFAKYRKCDDIVDSTRNSTINTIH